MGGKWPLDARCLAFWGGKEAGVGLGRVSILRSRIVSWNTHGDDDEAGGAFLRFESKWGIGISQAFTGHRHNGCVNSQVQ